jgi:Xaa-Pro dipeptidase
VREHHRARIERIKAAAAVDGIDCLAFMPGTNLFYLTGVELHLSERPTILFVPVEDEAPVWFAPRLELSKLQEHTGLEGTVWSDEEGPGPAMRQLMEEVAPSDSNTLTLGCEYRMMRLL